MVSTVKCQSTQNSFQLSVVKVNEIWGGREGGDHRKSFERGVTGSRGLGYWVLDL